MLGFPWDLHALRELLGGLFRALRLGGLCSCACFVERVRNFFAFQDQQEGLNSFRVAFSSKWNWSCHFNGHMRKMLHASSESVEEYTFCVCELALGL